MDKHNTVSRYWEFQTEEEHYRYLIGSDYGKNPVNEKEKIENDKAIVAFRLASSLKLKPEFKGLEIGAGCGYLTKHIASKVARLYACDISSTYLELAKTTCDAANNVSFEKIEPCSLSFLSNETLDFIYSNNVFIHLEFYEIFQYLKESARVLKHKGKMWFDLVELERLDVLSNQDFDDTINSKKRDPFNKQCIQFNSVVSVQKAARKLGFLVLKTTRIARCNTQILLCKI